MGYDSRYSGEIRIVPPLTWSEVQNQPNLRDLEIKQDRQVEDTPAGQNATILGVAVVPVMSHYAGYRIAEDLQALVDAYPDRAFTGHIEAWPDDAAPPWRHVVRGRRAVEITAQIHWWEPECGFDYCPVGCPDPACPCSCHLPKHTCVPFGTDEELARERATCPGCIAEDARDKEACA